MSATPSIVIGKEGFGIKNGNLLGYYRADDGIYVARQFTATRGGGTNGTFVNSSGLIEVAASPNLPRIDFSSGSKAVLIEPAATNLAWHSQTWDTGTNWNLTRTTTVTGTMDTLDPFGTNTANAISPTAVTGSHYVASNNPTTISFTSGTIYTQSGFFKQGTGSAGRYVQLTFANTRFPQNGYANFDLQTGAVVASGGSADTNRAASIENYGNGWYRCRLTATCTQSGLDQGVIPVLITASGDIRTPPFEGVTSDVLYGWGAQIETGAVATSYIPTTTGTITRNADVITLANASEYIGQTEGTVYMEVDLRNLSTGIFRRLINVTDGTLNNRLQINTTDTNSRLQLLLFQGGVTQVSIVSPSAFSGVVKLAAAYAVNDIAFYVNGVQIGTDTSASIPACSQVNLGTNVDGASAFNDRIRAAAIYTTRLSDAQLIDMTWQ